MRSQLQRLSELVPPIGGWLWIMSAPRERGVLQSQAMTARVRCGMLVASFALVVSTAVVAPLSAEAAGPCTGADCDVVPDPDDAQYVGNGGLLLPGDSFTGTADDRTSAATCEGCRWALLPMCRGDGHAGGVNCGPAARSCPPGEFRRIVMLLRPGGSVWEVIGLVCLSPTGPTTVDDVAHQLHDVVIEEVPPLRARFQPEGGTLVQLPAIFDSGQPRRLGVREFSLVGFDIVLRGEASWTWQFGDGASLVTREPGGGWPDDSVSHVYEHSGAYGVLVTSEWRAWFTVDGMGPFAVGGDPVTQTSGPLDLAVRSARAELVAD